MKKLLALLVLLCVVMSSTSVSANHQHREYIDYGEVKVITIPEPDEHFKNNYLYYTHYLIFKPTVSDTYRIIINYEEDEANPYPIYLGITSYIKVNGNDRYIDGMEYRIVEDGLEFYGEVGTYYEIMFQYIKYDKRHPTFSFYVESAADCEKNFEWTDDIAYGEKKTITIPEPDVKVNDNYTYLTQFFHFTPKVEGTYRFMVSYEEDESNPYPIFMDVAPFIMVNGQKQYCSDQGYWEIENGCEFEAKAGISYELMFQYMNNDGRNPKFTFYLETDLEIPKTGDAGLLLPGALVLLSTLMTACLILNRKKFQ